MILNADFNKEDILRLKRVIDELSTKTDRLAVEIFQQSAIRLVLSAAKAQGPTEAPTPAKLPIGYKRRPLSTNDEAPYHYGYHDNAGKLRSFVTTGKLSKKSIRERDAWRLNKEVTLYDGRKIRLLLDWYMAQKKKGELLKLSDNTRDRNSLERKSMSILRIPHYGAAKAGWLKVLDHLPRGTKRPTSADYRNSDRAIQGKIPSPTVYFTRSDACAKWEALNNVSYAEYISPMAAKIAMEKTANYMEQELKRALAKLEKQGKL